MTANFENKVVVVTGATSGIGRAAATLFAAQGASVVVAGRRIERGESVVSDIRRAGGEATFIRTDVSSSASVENLVEQTLRVYGRLDCAFNNAGIPGDNQRDCSDQSEACWDAVMSVNLRGIWLCMKHELAHMRKAGRGAVVNTASMYGQVGSDLGIAPYIASKHGVIGLTRAAAVEFGKTGVRINALLPGCTRTEMIEPAMVNIPDIFERHIQDNVPMGRVAEPDEIARAVLWLCSDEASYVTGATFAVDGGWLAR